MCVRCVPCAAPAARTTFHQPAPAPAPVPTCRAASATGNRIPLAPLIPADAGLQRSPLTTQADSQLSCARTHCAGAFAPKIPLCESLATNLVKLFQVVSVLVFVPGRFIIGAP
ncbi:hypothetical protein BN2475_80051 [Paraburkholderia ribeironis]|uniref:Uncharacterized protein n=1 Tax=Paraburkholderia ribeironis TaxID=1247936 RepID=A0A1N7RMA7_9BURK|nr:hypothetical protein BN2475_80051 [Paraburkholderia ribeironis]